jgi:hypothetical protein
MKNALSILVLAGIVCTLAFRVQSDEPNKASRPTFHAAPVYLELLDTLELALSGYLTEYEAGRSGPDHAIRLNKQLYEQQRGAVQTGRLIVVENYLERAKQIERIAKLRLDNGIGTSQQMLEAKAARLLATLELEISKDFSEPH